MEYYSVINRSKTLIYDTAWMNFDNIMLSERNQIQKATNYPKMKHPE
jgi:hypothetical protein